MPQATITEATFIGDADLSSAAMPRGRPLHKMLVAFSAAYFAGALVLPYRPFLDAAETVGYDIALLQRRFDVGYETVAHRLSTLQRPGARGVPFIFVRVDRAGNVSKRLSATRPMATRSSRTAKIWTAGLRPPRERS